MTGRALPAGGPADVVGDASAGWHPAAVAGLLLVPIAAVNALGFVLPVLNLLVISFRKAEATGAMTEAWTAGNWAGLVRDAYYYELLWTTVWISLLITVLTLLASYPIALTLSRMAGTGRSLLLVLVISPLLTSAVVRTYGWIAILSDQGLVNTGLAAAGLAPMRLMFNDVGVVIGLVEILMPYMIIALLSGFGRLDPRLEEAAATLGARPLQAFVRVVVPLSLPGVALGCLLCFVLAVSSFITPKLLGGGRVFLLATEIYDQAVVTLNWPLAASISILVLLIFGLALGLYTRTLKALA